MADETPELMTRTEVAMHLGIHPTTINRWIREGRIQVAERLPNRESRYARDHVESLGLGESLMTPSKAAQELGVHPQTVRRWAGSGYITSLRTPGGHRRFPRQEVEALARQLKKQRKSR